MVMDMYMYIKPHKKKNSREENFSNVRDYGFVPPTLHFMAQRIRQFSHNCIHPLAPKRRANLDILCS